MLAALLQLVAHAITARQRRGFALLTAGHLHLHTAAGTAHLNTFHARATRARVAFGRTAVSTWQCPPAATIAGWHWICTCGTRVLEQRVDRHSTTRASECTCRGVGTYCWFTILRMA